MISKMNRISAADKHKGAHSGASNLSKKGTFPARLKPFGTFTNLTA